MLTFIKNADFLKYENRHVCFLLVVLQKLSISFLVSSHCVLMYLESASSHSSILSSKHLVVLLPLIANLKILDIAFFYELTVKPVV